VRLSWRWHAIAALARLGLAHGLAQHLHIIRQGDIDFLGIVSPFLIRTHGYMGFLEVHSQWITSFTGLCVLLLFALAEAGLLSAFSLMIQQFVRNHSTQKLVIIVWRCSLILGTIMLMLAVKNIYKSYKCCNCYNHNLAFCDSSFTNYLQMRENILPPLKVAHRVGFTLLDNGTMVATEIMLPIGDDILFGCADSNYYFSQCQKFDNLPHVLGRLLLSFFGLLLYAFLTGCCLFLAHRRYQWQVHKMMIATSSKK
jgi:hypothetical protein